MTLDSSHLLIAVLAFIGSVIAISAGSLDRCRFVMLEVRLDPFRILWIRSPVQPPSRLRGWIEREVEVIEEKRGDES